MNALALFAAVTMVGTAILTTAAVAKLLVSPITSAVADLKEAVIDIKRKQEEDVKELWKYLAEHR